MADGRVRVDADGIAAQLALNRFDSVDVEFVPDRGVADDGVVAALDRAARVADAEQPEVAAENAVRSLAGASIKVSDLQDPAALPGWLGVVARELGDPGVLRATPITALPRWLRRASGVRLTGFVAYDGSLVEGSEADVRAWCGALAEWAAESGGEGYLSVRGMTQAAPASGLGDAAARAVRGGALTVVTWAAAEPGAVSQVAFLPDGQTTVQVLGRSDAVARVRAALVAVAEQTRLAFVAPVPAWAYGWDVLGSRLRGNSAAWRRAVPDAYGIQLLRGAHLERVSDLGGWRVTEVAPDHFLVEAADLALWLADGGVPDPVRERARADFGSAVE